MKYEIQIQINKKKSEKEVSCIKVSNKYQNFWKLLDRVLTMFFFLEKRED